MGYSNGLLESDEKGGSGERGEQGLPGIGFKLTDDGNFDINGKRLTDVSQPVDSGDATTKAYVDGEIGHHTGNFYHLRQSFTFYDSSGTELALSTDSITGLVTDYKHGYYKIPKSGDDNYFSTLDIKIRNNLPQSTYSALFYLYGYRNNSIMSGVDLGPILFGVDGTNYNILKYDDDDSTETRNHTKGIIWFTSDGSNGSIELGLRFFDKSITHFVILSRCVEGKVNLGFSSNIFNVSSTVGDVILYFEDINMNSRKIKNLGGPTDDGDVTNKKYVDTENAKQDIAINSKFDKTGGIMSGDLRIVGDIYMNDHDIVGVKDPLGLTYCANKKYVDNEIAKVDSTTLLPRDGSRSMTGDLDIGGNNILSVENLVDYKDTDPYDYRVKDVKSVVNKEYLNENFIKKVDKDGIEYYDLKGNIIRNCEPYYDGLFTDNDLVSKKYVQVENVKQDIAINNISFISSYNTNLIKALQTSKVEKLYVDDNFLNIDGSKSMTGNIDMGGFTIKNVKQFVEDDSSQAASDAQRNEIINFGYFKDQRADIMKQVDDLVGDALPKDGSEAMQGSLNMNNNSIISCGRLVMVADGNSPINMNNSYIYGRLNPLQNDDAANKAFVDTRDNLNLPLDGSRSMSGNLDINNNTIINLKDPLTSDSSYATNVNFVNKTVDNKIKESEERSIRSLNQENVFKKVMDDGLFIEDDDDIHQIGVVDKDFHKVNKKTYHFQIDYDNSIGYYSTRLGVNVVYLPIGYYILAFEMFFSDKIDNNNITVDCLSGTLQILSKNTKYSSDHSRSIFNFRKTVARPSDDEVDIDITLKNKSGETYDSKTDIYVVVYGVEGLGNDVESIIWDRYFYVDDKKIHFEAPIDMVNKDIENVNDLSINNELNMNNRQIKNLGDGNENSDGVNVKQLNDLKTNVTNYVTGEIGKVNPVLSNNSDLIKFIYRNLIRNDSKLLLIKELYFPDSVQGRTQNSYIYHTNGDNKGDVTFYLTFVHKATTSDNMMIALHWEGLSDNIYIYVSKDKVETSINPLIDDPSLASYNIPSYYRGKQVYLWITIRNDLIRINFSGSIAISGTHPDLENNDANIWRINVSDSPFTIQRGLITKNIYNVNSDAYRDVREYEISEGTFVSAV